MVNDDRPMAVYWDFENVVLSQFDFVHGSRTWSQTNTGGSPDDDLDEMLATAHLNVSAVVDYVSTLGPISIHRAYGDWSRRWLNRYDRDMLRHSVDLVQIFPARGTKNGADIRMAIDVVRDLQVHPHIRDVVIVAGDSDFISLAQHCRREGRRVTGVGVRRSVSHALVSSCDVFKYVDTLTQKKVASQASTPRALRIPVATRQLVRDALVQLGSETTDGWVRRVHIKPLLLRLDSAFDESETGAATFTEFLQGMADTLESRQGDTDREYRLVEGPAAAAATTSASSTGPSSTSGSGAGAEGRQVEAREALRLILTAAGLVGRELHGAQVHTAMQLALPGFDFGALGYPNLSAFVDACSEVAVLDRHKDGYQTCRLVTGAEAELSERLEAALRTCPTRIGDVVAGHLRGGDPLAAAYAATLRASAINLPTDRALLWRLVAALPKLLADAEGASTRGQVAATLDAKLARADADLPEADAAARLPEQERRRLFGALGGLAISSGLVRKLQAFESGDAATVTSEMAITAVANLAAKLVRREVVKEGAQVEEAAFVNAMVGEDFNEPYVEESLRIAIEPNAAV